MLEVCGLNIVATPHPNGVYERILRTVAGTPVRVRGNDWAKITEPKASSKKGVLDGRIIVWTTIDVDGRWLDTTKDEELSRADKKSISIPSHAKPNYRVFSYALDVNRHRIHYESLNEFGETLGPTVARRLFENLTAMDKVKEAVEVTILPQEGTVNRILTLPKLRRLEIKLLLPNPDDVDPDKQQKLYEKLRSMNAKTWEQTLQKRAGAARLKPDEETKEIARVAATNGYVKGDAGRGDDRVQLSTTDTPARKKVSMDAGANFVARLLATGGFF